MTNNNAVKIIVFVEFLQVFRTLYYSFKTVFNILICVNKQS